jgi:transcriptional regulator with XRE-family HTH domain
MKLEELIAEWKSDPEFARAYEDRAPEFEIARAVIRHRLELGLTQAELAAKVGTKQASISRLENAAGHPSFSFLKRVARALGVPLHVGLGDLPTSGQQPQPKAVSSTSALIWPTVLFRDHPRRTAWSFVMEPDAASGSWSASVSPAGLVVETPVPCDAREAA